MASVRIARALVALGAVVLISTAVVPPARGDVLILTDGAHLVGQLDAPQLSVLTHDGVVQAAPNDLSEVRLGTIDGDVVRYRTGRAVIGLVDQPRYAVRLASGQTIVVERRDVSLIHFGR